METKHEVWFRDPCILVHNLLANADFDHKIDISPFQEYDANDNHRYQNFMSGNWAWKQAVRFYYLFIFEKLYVLIINYQCLFLSSLEVIRPPFQLLPVTPNTGQFIYQSETSITMYNMPIKMA